MGTAPELTAEELEAMNEHANTATWWGPLTEVKADYGNGIYIYFKYVWYLMLFNAVLSVPALVTFIGAAGSGLDDSTYSGLGLLAISAFPDSVTGLWYAMTSIGALLALASPFVYRWYQSRIEAAWKGAERTEETAEGEDIIEENRDATSSERRSRRTVSMMVFLVILVGQGILTYYLQLALVSASSSVVALALSGMLAILNMVWKKISKTLTKYETHRTKREYTEWDTSKVFILKIGSVLSLYITKSLLGADRADSSDCLPADVDCGCPLEDQGQQFFFLIITEIVVGNIMELGVPILRVWFRTRKSLTSGGGDEDDKDNFDLADEFTELFYRQFIVLLGMVVFPLMAPLGAASLALEYALDKYRLLHFCKKPLVKPDPVRSRLILGCQLAVSVIVLLSYPNGVVFIFSGLNLGDCRFLN